MKIDQPIREKETIIYFITISSQKRKMHYFEILNEKTINDSRKL